VSKVSLLAYIENKEDTPSDITMKKVVIKGKIKIKYSL